MQESEANSLFKVTAAIVDRLKDEPVLLGGMGAGALIAIIAVFAPAGTQMYGWIVGGLMLVLCLGKLILESRGPRLPGQVVNDVKIDDDSHFEDLRVGGDHNKFRSGKRVTVKGATFGAGTPRTHPVTKDGETNQQ